MEPAFSGHPETTGRAVLVGTAGALIVARDSAAAEPIQTRRRQTPSHNGGRRRTRGTPTPKTFGKRSLGSLPQSGYPGPDSVLEAVARSSNSSGYVLDLDTGCGESPLLRTASSNRGLRRNRSGSDPCHEVPRRAGHPSPRSALHHWREEARRTRPTMPAENLVRSRRHRVLLDGSIALALPPRLADEGRRPARGFHRCRVARSSRRR